MRTRIPAALAAIIGWGGLALQFALLVSRMGPLPGAWRYFGYYTILTNIGAALVASATALGLAPLSGPRPRLVAATSILMVGVVYAAALRGLWHPVGLQKLSDAMLHDAVPGLWLIFWIVADGTHLKWHELWWALVPPGLYLFYALTRGAMDGWYAYWFLDPSRGSGAEMAMSVVILLSSFAFVATVLIAVDRAKRRLPRPQRRGPGPVEEAGLESFPASDPPAWTLGKEVKR